MGTIVDADGAFKERLRLLEFRTTVDSRGSLTEFANVTLPFHPQRSFVIAGVPRGTKRGGHAHRECEQVLVCLQGQVTVEAALDSRRANIVLNRPSIGLFVGARVWTAQTYDHDQTVLLAFASLPYDPESYVPSDEYADDAAR